MDLKFQDTLLVFLLGILVVFAVLGLITVCILLINRVMRGKKGTGGRREAVQTPVPAAQTDAPLEVAVSAQIALSQPVSAQPAPPLSDGRVRLNTVSDRTAALLMAIVSHDLGIALEELQFRSIQEIGPAEGAQL